MLNFDSDFFVPLMIFAVPIVAIAGGITAGIVRTLGNQRLVELAQRERIAAIERGIDPAKLPPLPMSADDAGNPYATYEDYARRRSHGLLIGGLSAVAAGAGLMAFGVIIEPQDRWWAVGIIPIAIGMALLASAMIIRRSGGPVAR